MTQNPSTRIQWLLACSLLLAFGAHAHAADGSAAVESLPPDSQVVRIEARPAEIELTQPFAYTQLLLTAELAGGERVDVTRIAELAEASAAVDVSDRRLIRVKTDGQAELKFTVAGQTVIVPVKVTGQSQDYAASFVREVMPAMSKLGCNAGTCHGSANGKNGFKLSLRGYDPAFDYQALTDDLGGRRFNRSAPDQSLMLLKACGGVPHVGGLLTKPGEPYYELIRNWIAAGVKLDLDSPRVKSIAVGPLGPVIPLPGRKQQMT
ncbi:MAG: hypothetical protein HY000_40775, partial [Planctomycetes bacterium]|nr:hypothetical protein [Planctomycetota bacterium]